MLKVVKNHWPVAIRSTFAGLGAFFLPVEAYEVLTDNNFTLPFSTFLPAFAEFILIILTAGTIYFFLDGHVFSGFLKKRVNIPFNGFDTKIAVKFGDLFAEKGWKAIGVNDFFDSQIDNKVIAKKSLHGHTITSYWPNDRKGWQKQINASLDGVEFTKIKRDRGNKKRFPIGTTAQAVTEDQNLLFVALGHTDENTYETSATAESLICAIRGMLQKARLVCANEPLFIPLMGTGLGRVGGCRACNGSGSVFSGMPCLQCGGTGNL